MFLIVIQEENIVVTFPTWNEQNFFFFHSQKITMQNNHIPNDSRLHARTPNMFVTISDFPLLVRVGFFDSILKLFPFQPHPTIANAKNWNIYASKQEEQRKMTKRISNPKWTKGILFHFESVRFLWNIIPFIFYVGVCVCPTITFWLSNKLWWLSNYLWSYYLFYKFVSLLFSVSGRRHFIVGRR